MSDGTSRLAIEVLAAYRARGWRIGTAESCTGGLVGGALTAIAGSSDVVEGGFITYSNAAKTALLGVPQDLLDSVGAVSAEVAAAMAQGVLRGIPGTDLAVSITGIAGPGGGTATKPVGLVYIGIARRDGPGTTERHVFPGDREAVRAASVRRALALLLDTAR
ncbi:MAG TPA: nicotinamide-nucleotide amidohydrolase family protein [Stellaceae bacterium]|nr:nicotinamide-nucleotide amidohydrolase family protein [Stellaceae bacterium]